MEGLTGTTVSPRLPFGFRGLFSHAGFKEKWLPLAQVHEIYARARNAANQPLAEAVLAELRVKPSFAESELTHVPVTGPVVVVCDRPFGIVEASVLAAVLRRVRPDVKVLADVVLKDVEGLEHDWICVDPVGNQSQNATSANAAALLRCVRWVRQGGLLVTFPADAVPAQPTHDPGMAWDSAVVRLARITAATIVPVHLRGTRRVASQALRLVHRGLANPALVHPSLQPALLLNEFLAQKGSTVHLRFGRPISASTVSAMEDLAEATRYLRWRTHLLGQRRSNKPNLVSMLQPMLPKPRRDRLTRPIASDALLADVENLRPEQILDDGREFVVFAAREHEIPNILPELGRLREVTFREAGEGTGRSTDLDAFDRYYSHIVLWSKQNREPVGAYRVGRTQDILPLRGIDGLYTSTLFRFDERFFEKLGPALELGRSFVRPEYQRQYAPLLLLWMGIARFIATHPETPVLFGAVSISGRYTRASRELIVRFFESRNSRDDLSSLVQPRRPFRPGRLRSWDCRSICHAMKELDAIADPIADMEGDGKGIPILIKHYSRLGGRLLGFNVDAKFSNVLDGLVVMDLRKTQPSTLERYMGQSETASFRRYHGLPAAQQRH